MVTCLSSQILKKNLQNEVLSLMTQVEAEATLVHEVYFLFSVRLKAMLRKWSDASVTSFGAAVGCLVGIVDE